MSIRKTEILEDYGWNHVFKTDAGVSLRAETNSGYRATDSPATSFSCSSLKTAHSSFSFSNKALRRGVSSLCQASSGSFPADPASNLDKASSQDSSHFYSRRIASQCGVHRVTLYTS